MNTNCETTTMKERNLWWINSRIALYWVGIRIKGWALLFDRYFYITKQKICQKCYFYCFIRWMGVLKNKTCFVEFKWVYSNTK